MTFEKILEGDQVNNYMRLPLLFAAGAAGSVSAAGTQPATVRPDTVTWSAAIVTTSRTPS